MGVEHAEEESTRLSRIKAKPAPVNRPTFGSAILQKSTDLVSKDVTLRESRKRNRRIAHVKDVGNLTSAIATRSHVRTKQKPRLGAGAFNTSMPRYWLGDAGRGDIFSAGAGGTTAGAGDD